MRFTCCHCALAAGLALSAAAHAEPAKQAGGLVLQQPRVALESQEVSPKISRIQRGKYYVATGRIEMEDGSTPVVRGPAAPVPIWQAIDIYGFYNGLTGAGLGGPATELYDWGQLCGDPATDTHSIQQFSFGYYTGASVPGDLVVTIYWDYAASACTPPAAGNCIAAEVNGFQFTGLPGDETLCDGFVDGYLFDAILTPDPALPPDPVTNPDLTFTMPAGHFGYSYSGWTTWDAPNCGTYTGPTGGMLVNEDQVLAPGTDDNMDIYTAAPQTGYLGRGGFTGYTQIYFELYGLTECAPSTVGACCLADLSCSVVDEAGCLAQGGTFSLGISCSGQFFCYPAPANDDCLTAQSISGFGQFAYDNRGATTGTEGASSCVTVTEDVWFSWTAPCTGDVSISTCLINATDDAFAVYQGSDCGNLATEVSCDDDGCGTVGGPSSATFAVTAGTNYLFRMGTWGETDGGENAFELTNVSCTGGPAFCDADWCQDGSVGVPDIFCFLSDWFANVPEARNYGGSPGVPAIFAFLSEWFSTGQGPCTP